MLTEDSGYPGENRESYTWGDVRAAFDHIGLGINQEVAIDIRERLARDDRGVTTPSLVDAFQAAGGKTKISAADMDRVVRYIWACRTGCHQKKGASRSTNHPTTPALIVSDDLVGGVIATVTVTFRAASESLAEDIARDIRKAAIKSAGSRNVWPVQ